MIRVCARVQKGVKALGLSICTGPANTGDPNVTHSDSSTCKCMHVGCLALILQPTVVWVPYFTRTENCNWCYTHMYVVGEHASSEYLASDTEILFDGGACNFQSRRSIVRHVE